MHNRCIETLVNRGSGQKHAWKNFCCIILPYSDKRKQVTKVTFPVKEQNVSVIYTDVNVIS